VGRDGEPGQAYGPVVDNADSGCLRGTRHGKTGTSSASSSRPRMPSSSTTCARYTRHLMSRMETDLGTNLDWVAVNHWNTDNPHTHIVLRGKDDRGKDLIISRDYIAQGMRERAAELATEWLGPRTELEIQQSLRRESRSGALDWSGSHAAT
jgi:type IV secretory pathway VirD2 relaxase